MLGMKVGTDSKAVEKTQESFFSWSYMLLEGYSSYTQYINDRF